MKRLNFVGLFSDARKIRGELAMKQQNCKRTYSPVILLNRIILGKICILDVWYSSVNFLLAFGNHVWKPLVLELGNDFIQLLIHCSSYWINSQLALYNRLHSLLILKLTIFSTANQFRQLYHNENSRIFFDKLWPTLKSLRITGRPELVLAHKNGRQ